MAKGAYIGVPTRTNPLGQFDIGSIVSLKVGGVPTDFIVVHQGNPDSNLYDASCDGTWLLMKDIYTNRAWSNSDVGYQDSTIHSYLNSEFLGLFDGEVQNAIKQVKIPYYSGASAVGSVYSGSNGLSAKVFLLGGIELGFGESNYGYLPGDGAVLSYFTGLPYMDAKRVANYQGSPAIWWLRSRKTTAQYRPLMVTANGGHNNKAYSTSYGIRPAIILPSNFGVGDMADVARKVKKGYIGIDGIARKIKKAYIGIGGVARPCFGGGKPVAYGTVTPLNAAVALHAAANAGDYLIFGGGATSWGGGFKQETIAYSKSLTVTTPSALNGSRQYVCGLNHGSYAIFAGGQSGTSTTSNSEAVDIYDASLTKQQKYLNKQRREAAGACAGNYALIMGGLNGNAVNNVDVFDASLTQSTKTLASVRYSAAGCTVGKYALVAGGSGPMDTVETFDSSLTRSTAANLSVKRYAAGGVSHAGYALIVGGWGDSGAVDVYDENLTHTVLASTVVKSYARGAVLGEYALLHGGRDSNWGMNADVIAYDKSLTCTVAPSLSLARWGEAAGTVGEFVLFGGGGVSSLTPHNTVDAYILG